MSNQEIVLASASQLSTFTRCKRKWAYDKIDGDRQPDTEATNEGKAIHKLVEDRYTLDVVPDRPEALALLTHLPQPSTGIRAEVEFTFLWPGQPALMRGVVDLMDFNTDTVFDHKTAGNLARSLKSPEDLVLDAQAVMYGCAGRLLGMGNDINLQWTYVQREQPKTRAPKTEPVRLLQTRAMLDAGLEHWDPVVAELVQITRKHSKADDVEANRDACYDFGPCHYRERCADFRGKPKQTVEVVVSPEMMARLAAASNAALSPAPIQATSSAVSDDIAPVAPAVAKEPPPMDRLATLRLDFGVTPAIVPPDAQPNVSPSDPVAPEPLPEASPKRGRKPKAPTAVELPMSLPPPPNATLATDVPSDFDLESFVESVVRRAKGNSDILVELEAARIGVELLKLRGAK